EVHDPDPEVFAGPAGEAEALVAQRGQRDAHRGRRSDAAFLRDRNRDRIGHGLLARSGNGPRYVGAAPRARRWFTLSDGLPAGVRMEARAVRALELGHDPQPLLLPAAVDGGDRAAAMGREARAEDDARVAQVRVGDDSL